MKRTTILLLSGALVLGFFLVGSVLAVRLGVRPAGSTPATATLPASSTTVNGQVVGVRSLDLDGQGKSRTVRDLAPGESVSLDLGTVQAIEASGSWKVVLVPGPVGKATLKAPLNQAFYLSVRTDDSAVRLSVRDSIDSDSWSGGSEPVLEVSFPELRRVDASGTSTFDLANLKVERLSLNLSGASQITGSGTVGDLLLDLSGASTLDLDRLVAHRVSLQASGAGQVGLRVEGGPVEGEVSGVVIVNVAGNPSSVQVDSSGMSAVNRR